MAERSSATLRAASHGAEDLGDGGSKAPPIPRNILPSPCKAPWDAGQNAGRGGGPAVSRNLLAGAAPRRRLRPLKRGPERPRGLPLERPSRKVALISGS